MIGKPGRIEKFQNSVHELFRHMLALDQESLNWGFGLNLEDT